ncbi:MAG: carboxypeptidase-like regulatory domain-containing protein [Chthoniobacterales bacterium]
MNTHIRSLVLLLATFVAAGAFAANPPVEVTVRPASGGKAIQKMWTDTNGSFELRSLPAGEYTLEFRAKRSPELRGKQFTLSIAGALQSGTQSGIAGTSLVGGVAIDVALAAGARVAGEIITGPYDGRTRYWEPATLGSNLPGRWTYDKHAVPVNNIVGVPIDIIQKIQDHGDTN